MSNNQATTVDIQQVQQSLYQKLEGTEWQSKLKMFILSGDYQTLLMSLLDQVNSGKRFTPRVKDTMNAFIECPYKDLKAVIVGQDPYPQLGVADGISFSCSTTGVAQPSLRLINAALLDCFPDYEAKTDLRVWANQGILMINTALTTEIGKPGTHYSIWEPFLAYLFDMLSTNNPKLVYLFMGKKAQEWGSYVHNDSVILNVSHPASAAYSGGKWNHNSVFQQLTDEVDKMFGYQIKW